VRGRSVVSRRVLIRKILADPAERRELLIRAGIAIQAREGIETTREQAEAAYDKVRSVKKLLDTTMDRR
jgi:hypothetical protein